MHVFRAIPMVMFASAVCAAPIESTFDTDTDGWLANGAALFEWRGTDGNPPGFLYIDNSENFGANIRAPVKFRGDLSEYLGGTFSFDGKMLGTGGSFFSATVDYGVITIQGGGTSATVDLLPGGATPSTTEWNTYSVPLTAAAWGKSESQWAGILASVSNIIIAVEALDGDEIQGIDNIRIAAVPAPAGLGLMLTAFAIAGTRRQARRRG